MLDTIYIVDEYLAKPKPGQDVTSLDQRDQNSRSSPASGPVFSTAFSVLPESLLSAAVNAIPSLGSLLYEDQSGDDAERNEKQWLLAAFLERATFSQRQALDAGYRFQPGHPLSGKSYRKHPLAHLSNKDTGHLYIPSEGYDAHVLEERESELIRLLVSLGATRISITKIVTNDDNGHLRAQANASAAQVVEVKAEHSTSSRRSLDTLDTRVFNLTPLPNNAMAAVDPDSFFWLPFEPSWKAVLFAREHGGCTEASLELKETTSFSEESGTGLSVSTQKGGAGLSVNIGRHDSVQRSHLIHVSFAPVSTD